MQLKHTRNSLRLLSRAIMAVALQCLLIQPSSAAPDSPDGVEIKPFEFQHTDSAFSIRYLRDDRTIGDPDGEATFEDRLTWEQELWVGTRSYVYHPGFLNIDFDLGPKLVQQQYDANAGSNDGNQEFLQFRTRLNFLNLKKYPFSLYYTRLNPSVNAGLSGRFLAETNEYGLDANLFDVAATNFRFALWHRDSLGEGFGRVVDSVNDGGSMTGNLTYWDGDTIEVEYGKSNRTSSNGSPGLPIQETKVREERGHLLTRNKFGAKDNFDFNQSYYLLNQDYLSSGSSDLDSWRYNSSLQVLHSDSIISFLSVDASDMKREDARSRSRGARAGVDHGIREDLSYGAKIDHREIRQTGFSSDQSAADVRANYQKNMRFGTLGLGANIAKARTDQESTADTVQVFDEAVTLIGTVQVDLANEFVVPGTVVVRNFDKTQVYVEDFDYRLVVVGSVTRIERLLNGNILDGETVLVDYEYRTSGTAEFDTLRPGASMSFTFPRFVSAAVRYSRQDTEVLSGELTTPINDQEVLEFSVYADVPIGRRWSLAADYRHRDVDEEISPSVTDTFSVSAKATFWQATQLALGARLFQVDLEKSDEDTDDLQLSLGISARPLVRTSVSYNIAYSRDVGGSLERSSLRHRLNFGWRYRAVLFSLRADLSDETQGTSDRTYKRVTAEVTRYFR
jgi:hypothetical protein